MKTLRFEENGHKYFLDDIRIPSVSEVLESVGISDYNMVDYKHLKTAQVRGDHVHHACRLFDYGTLKIKTLDQQWRVYLDAYKKFLAECKPSWLLIEHVMYSEKYMFATTPDRIGHIDGVLADVEIKTTTSIMKSVRPQTAAHVICYNERYPYNERIRKRYCLQLKDNGTYSFVQLKDSIDENIFLCALNVFKFKGGCRV